MSHLMINVDALHCGGHLVMDTMIGCLIASDRDLGDVENKKEKWAGKDCTALEIARGEQS